MFLPKVSICIPTYNRKKLIKKAIDSALAQNYSNLEVIVSDNASTDGTSEVISGYLSVPKFHFYKQTENVGALKNWQKLLYEYSTGEWVYILGSDDYLIDNSFISKGIELALKDNNCYLFHGNLKYVNENTGIERITNKICPDLCDGKWYFWDPQKVVFVHISNSVFKKEIAIKLDAFKYNSKGHEYIGVDAKLLSQLLLVGKVAFVDSVANVYRIHEGSGTVTAPLSFITSQYRCFDEIWEFGYKLDSSLRKDLDKWKKKWYSNFLKSYYFTLVKSSKIKAFAFLMWTVIHFPITFIRTFLKSFKSFAGLVLSLFFPKSLFISIHKKIIEKSNLNY